MKEYKDNILTPNEYKSLKREKKRKLALRKKNK
jgi:hypothetical protein